MKRLFLFSILLIFGFQTTFSQILQPVKWQTSYNQVDEDEFDLIYTATIDPGWTVYSQFLEGEDGPVPTSFFFDEGDHFEKVGKTKEEGNRKEGFDPIFEMNVVKFAKKATFTQRVKVSDLSKAVSGYLEYMTCDDKRCLPPTEVDFNFALESTISPSPKTEQATTPKKQPKSIEQKTNSDNERKSNLNTQAQETDVQIVTDNPVQGGILDPAKWSIETRKAGDDEYDLVFKVKLDKGWNIYTQFIEGNDGPIPTTIYLDEGNHFEKVGEAKERGSNRIDGFDKIFNMNIVKFKEDATFVQRLKISDPSQSVTGAVEFMVCDETQCLPPTEISFRADFSALNAVIGDNALTIDEVPVQTSELKTALNADNLKTPVGECGNANPFQEKKGLWSIFVLGFFGGLIALLTPCVFPMIPLTVSFFTKGSQNKKKGMVNAFLYGFFILLVYLLLSLPFHLMDSINPGILNDISTNIWLNIAFFAIFMFFAFSFFGYYELTLPSSWTNKASSAEGIGGIVGIFFMAVTLALVSFSCTGPILGSLLAGALTSDGGAMQLTSGMAGFGFALALPFGLFAAFPGWMNSMPKSGGWLNTVKVVLGFLELALAFKFLSNADLVKHWELLKIEPFLAIWILIFLGLGFYLFGKIKFPHDSPIKKLSLTRKILGALSFAFVIYLASGFVYDQKIGSLRPLKLLSGLAPPVCYSWLYPCDCPQNLNCFKDFDEGIAYAKEVNKPVIIDFTGHACVNCRKMEEHVWPEPEVYKLLKNEYVLISLYVDEKVELPEEEQVVVESINGGTEKLRTVGKKWQHFQTKYFNNNSQPYYVLLSPDGKLLNNPVAYTPDAEKYADFLKCGLESWEKLTDSQSGGDKSLGSKD